jgi:hypothetical protein
MAQIWQRLAEEQETAAQGHSRSSPKDDNHRIGLIVGLESSGRGFHPCIPMLEIAIAFIVGVALGYGIFGVGGWRRVARRRAACRAGWVQIQYFGGCGACGGSSLLGQQHRA